MSFQDLEAARPFSYSRNGLNGKQDLTQAVAAGIFQISTAVSAFQRQVNSLGTPKDSPELREKLYAASEIDVSDKSPEQHALLVGSRGQEVLLLDNEIVFNEAIIEEREQGIKEIQQQIGEVNEIFKDLAVLVHEQGAMIYDIDSHIESAQAATTQGNSHLLKASKTQRSNSSLTCLLLVIFGIILLIVVVVVAV